MGDVTRSRRSPGEPFTRDRETFAGVLMDLERRGCCVLVTGRASERVLVLTTHYLPEDISPAHSTVTTLDYTDVVRDITSTVTPSLQPADSVKAPQSETGLGALLCDPIETAVRDGSLGPGELRLGVATLGVILDTDGLSATRSFVRTLRQHMLAVRGMGHFHLPGSPDSETITVLYPLFDIHIELHKSMPKHRWHLLETDYSTDWLPM